MAEASAKSVGEFARISGEVFGMKRKSKSKKLHLPEPFESFRVLPIIPTFRDIELRSPFLRPNLTKGRYIDAEDYLDVQFRLLKEDYVKPFRDRIDEYLSIKKNMQPVKECRNVYSDVFVKRKKYVRGELLHIVKFQDDSFSEIDWEESKRLLNGNILGLSTDDFRTMLFATIIYRDPKQLKKGLLTVKFEKNNDTVLSFNPSINFVVIETAGLFESCRHNLRVLQETNEAHFPMQRYIVDVEKTVNSPNYLKLTTTFDMTPLLLPLNSEFNLLSTSKNCPKDLLNRSESVTVTDDSSWPTAKMLNLDESQYAALKLAITKEFAIIQGPPGTGKTFIGLRVVQLLLHNINSWFHDKPHTMPILIVCQTNHSLDQFLEGISMFTDHIVRVGGRLVSPKIEKFKMRKLAEEVHIPEWLSVKISQIEDLINKLQKEIGEVSNCIEHSITSLLNDHILRQNIPYYQFKSLKDGYVKDGNDASHPVKYMIYDWLQVWATSTVENESKVNMFTNTQRNDFLNTYSLKRDSLSDAESDENFHIILGLNNMSMDRRKALSIKNVWTLAVSNRWKLFNFWLSTFIGDKQKVFENLQLSLKSAYKSLYAARIEIELLVLKSALVVGMTATGAAKYRYLIRSRNPVVVIVEEAAELLESHIITSLTPRTQHVMLIGDQQQLRPSPAVYELGTKYRMNISLFERMIMNGMDYCRLSIQHRMRPEIAALIAPHIYPNLDNHEVVTKFEDVKGIRENVFFVTHEFTESSMLNSSSKTNEHEARFIIELCRYLLLQGYSPSEITVLTAYSDQVSVFKSLATGALEKVRFTSVDNYQGEENDIVLVSFVRSNMEGEVGFLKVPNRINVALSRAKKGLYCIGNFNLLAQKSKLWRNIVQSLANKKSIGKSLCLVCQNHPNVFTEVTKGADFAAVTDKRCFRKCECPLQRGYTSHEDFKCSKASRKKQHCLKKCFEANEMSNRRSQIGALKDRDNDSFEKSSVKSIDESNKKREHKRTEENSTAEKQVLRDFLQIPKDSLKNKIQENSLKNENVTIEKVEPNLTENCNTSEEKSLVKVAVM